MPRGKFRRISDFFEKFLADDQKTKTGYDERINAMEKRDRSSPL